MEANHFTLAPTNNNYYAENHILYLNGSFLKANEVVTDLYSQTLHYGYGAFEGIRAYPTENGTRIFKSQEHYERLKKSCELIGIPFNYDPQELTEATYELLRQNGFTDAYIRPLVFCSPNMSLNKPNEVSIMICAWEWGAYLGDNLLNVMISSYCRPHPKSIKIEAKACGHYVNSILATSEAKAKGYDEAVLLDSDGYLAECSGANLFFEKDGKLFTPQLGNILPGITRATVLELCEELGVELQQGLFSQEDFENADSAFLCGTAAEIVGLKSVNKKDFPLEWNNSLGRKIQVAYKDLVMEKKNQFESQLQ
jgi:branched-chain amino acid aminotransferase